MYLLSISENNTVKSEFHNYLLTKIFQINCTQSTLKETPLKHIT